MALPDRLPCPFCGCTEIGVGGDYPEPHGSWLTEAYCSNENCGVAGPRRRGPHAAIEAWNTRPQPHYAENTWPPDIRGLHESLQVANTKLSHCEAAHDTLVGALQRIEDCAGSHTIRDDYIRYDCGFGHIFMIASRALATPKEDP